MIRENTNTNRLKRFDFLFVVLVLSWLIPVFWQSYSTTGPKDWETAFAKVTRVGEGGFTSDHRNARVSYTFTTKSGNTITHTMSSLPIMFASSEVLEDLRHHDVLVYYSPVDPQQSVAPSVGAEFSNMVCWNYGISVFILGFIKLGLNAMSAMSNEPTRSDSSRRQHN